ncbi:low molecular weight phosphotyrosine protein phosphatase [Nicoliella spurrieriana]|uniref:protein-tyrosine-phosphatase n=1 Tax=Nicoliella spurrieriana TaxID=2925830 RepID=A0A976X5M0_9LACO|nr:low molecular weight protein-tyrosine-phosphatase [Nicoliella spurrieriana]UQS87060.1 low molecular weight phosphotyrosine protein phosphatase [Nicoliella spurrieriana]
MVNVLFVCLGNVCRSPMAEVIFKQLVAKQGLTNQITVRSAATSDEEQGNQPQPGTIKTLTKHHLPWQQLRASQITLADFEWADYIITMDHQNVVDLKRIAPADCQDKIHLCLDIFPDQKGTPIPDPWYTHRFDYTYDVLAKAMPAWLTFIKRHSL